METKNNFLNSSSFAIGGVCYTVPKPHYTFNHTVDSRLRGNDKKIGYGIRFRDGYIVGALLDE